MITVKVSDESCVSALQWARKHCNSYVNNDLGLYYTVEFDNVYVYCFFFENEEDATIFKLKFGK